MRTIFLPIFTSLALGVAACSSGSDDSSPPPVQPPLSISKAQAYRFLNQATFGATEAEAQRVISTGFDAWIEDQLRQRVAFALSEIMVVSQLGVLNDQPFALASYYDMLADNAIGNYRELIEKVTLHPAMGAYLSMLGNEKPDAANNIRPDENFARELMQLFSVGLVELNEDGTVKFDALGRPIPTYDQSVIEGFAHVYTG